MRSSLLDIFTTLLLAVDLSAAVPSVSWTSPSPQQPLRQHGSQSDRLPIWCTLPASVLSRLRRLDSCQPKPQRPQPPLASKSRHGEDIVLRFNITNSQEARKLAEVADYMYLDVWEHTSDWMDVRMAQDTLPHVLRQLPESLRDSHTALLQGTQLQQAILDTFPSTGRPMPLAPSQDGLYTPTLHTSTSKKPHTSETNIFFTDYQPLSVITPWMRLLASLFTTHVQYVTIGTSFEGREIPALRVGVHPTNDDEAPPPRKTIVIMGGIHAREWISVSTVTYVAYHLITAYGKDQEVTQLLEDFDWLFIPTINPDGYIYTWESDRLWRKNRQETSLRFCPGLDLDRTFDFHWDSSTAGNPCSERYAGEAASEGVEAKALADWVRNETEHNNVEFVGLLDLHSYSQQILWPFSYSCDAVPPSLENLEELALGLSKAIRIVSGHSYISKQACEGSLSVDEDEKKARPFFDGGGGSALDWFYHEAKIRYPYQIKLRDRGAYGFLLPKEHIVPSGKELLEAALYFGRYVDGDFEGARVGRTSRTRPMRSQS